MVFVEGFFVILIEKKNAEMEVNPSEKPGSEVERKNGE